MDNRERKTAGKREESGGLSRRSFLKYGGLFAGAAAVGVGAGGLTGCAAGDGAAGAPDVAPTSTDLPEYEVFDTDMLVIGAGFGAMSACDEAVRQGKQVMVIDKGPYGFGGACGMNWDICYTWSPEGTDDKDVYFSTRTTNKQLYVNAATSDPHQPNDYVPIINWGETCPQRNEDGTVLKKIDLPTMGMVEWGFPRHMLDHFAQSDCITVHDLTMITDVFISDGVCVGAVGIYLPTGAYRVYRSKATVLATGGCTWLYGWVTLSSVTNNTPDNTADVEMAVFRHGGRIGDAEHAAYDMMGIVPSGWASSEGSMFGGDSMDIEFMLDKDGVAFCLDESLDQERMILDRPYFNQVVAKVIMDGRGGPNGGIFLPANDEMRKQMRYMYLRCVNLIEEKTGTDLRTEPMECLIEMYEHGGTPVIDDNMMSTEFPGLFCVRGAGVAGEAGGSTNNRNRVLGSYAFRCALDYLESYKEPESLDWSSVEEEIRRLEDLRTREVSGGLRPVEIQRKIQGVSYGALGVIRTTESLEAARTELKRILDEDLPKMTVSSHTRTYNRDWKDAIETINLLELARLSVEGTYLRPESRGNFYRPDYPEQNDDEWKCVLALRAADGGELAYDKVTYPDVEFPA
ncbi:FAD-dependent oxidoreductase [Arabiibacter massiliensis]|uniref:FAD-dependent oxidoreductase n=1 Tax=Arabiibacter massiliensis TaxID=1870985 RepID=UPI00155A71FB|nr:FAD-binding protein [Arabiibacter massiliensis]